VQLSGTGAQAAPNLAWSGTARSLDFGSSTVGAAAPMQTLTLSNQGPGAATLSALQLTGPAAADFLLDGSSTCTSTTTLAVASSCQLVLGFVPKAAGARAAVLSIASNGNSPGDISLNGSGVAAPAPALNLSSHSLAFTRPADGSAAPAQSLTLRNSGNATLNIKALTLKGGAFSLSTAATAACKSAPFSLAAGEQCTLQLAWSGAASGDTGTLEISSDASPAVDTVALSGSVASGTQPGNAGGGGCTIGQGTQERDPALLLMALGAVAMLARRARKASSARSQA
ncbi:MAG TPA: choice-of-anchor D domain-containing protein, partial [Burkholderiaceae bacterium]|nr:choice-of-anchor D domain-containing protein [Burkholderiaceae bacterium]